MRTAREELYAHLSKLVEPNEANAMIDEFLSEYRKEISETLYDLGETHFSITNNMNKGQYTRIIRSSLSA